MSRKSFTIYVSVYNTHPLLELKSVGKKCGLYTGKDGNTLEGSCGIMNQNQNLTITLKQKKIQMKNRFKEKKIPDDYYTLYGAGHVTLICLPTYWSQQSQFTHEQKGESSTITTMYVWNRRSNNRTHMANMSIIPTSHKTDMVRRNIRSCMGRKNN